MPLLTKLNLKNNGLFSVWTACQASNNVFYCLAGILWRIPSLRKLCLVGQGKRATFS
uniref:Uncharacterized protein n=1 Tax=Rhizophora mucronata TaxID=61149 RepID=A0A2P2MUD0_RHIMU